MKTAMQILNDEIKGKIIPSSKENGDLTDYQYGHNVAYGVVLTLIEYLLEKEKEQIMTANIEGTEHGYRERSVFGLDARPFSKKRAENYYNQTYIQNK